MANTASSPFRPLPKPISTLRLDYPKGTSPPASPVRGVFQRTPEFDALLARVLRPGGAHGAVCKTVLTHDSTGKKEEVALKVLPLRDQVDIARELGAWRALHHARVVPLYGSRTLPDHIVLVSPWMKQGHLLEYLVQNPDADRQELLVQVAEGLVYLHDTERIVHGDIKAENVLVDDSGNVKIADFGLSTYVEKPAGDDTTRTSIRGRFTMRFCAPELLMDKATSPSTSELLVPPAAPADARVRSKTKETDVYAYGMLMLQTFTGKQPWHGLTEYQVWGKIEHSERPPLPDRDAAVARGLNRGYWLVCMWCWEPEPADRLRMQAVHDLLDLLRDERMLYLPLSEFPSDTEDCADVPAPRRGAPAKRKRSSLLSVARRTVKSVHSAFKLQDGESHLALYPVPDGWVKSNPSVRTESPEHIASPDSLPSSPMSTRSSLTRKLWQSVRQHFELYEGTAHASYYPCHESRADGKEEREHRDEEDRGIADAAPYITWL